MNTKKFDQIFGNFSISLQTLKELSDKKLTFTPITSEQRENK